MIGADGVTLYHVTSLDRAAAIVTKGLLPHDCHMTGGEWVVWLTEWTGLAYIGRGTRSGPSAVQPRFNKMAQSRR